MRIAQIEFSHFRGIREGLITLPEHGVLLGPNNVGKTAVTDALALVFGRERVVYQLSDWDFFGGRPKPDSRFTIICSVTGFSGDDPQEHPDWFGGQSAAQPVWWHDDKSQVTFESDRPAGAHLAAQIALCARYDDESCEFEAKRYFYHGSADPFTDGCDAVSQHRIQELGVFILPASRQWDRLLSFGSSTFIKALRQSNAMPGDALGELKGELSTPRNPIENSSNLKPVLEAAEAELRLFLMLPESSRLAYKPTSLDTVGVLQSLLPHIRDSQGDLLPLSRQGAGMVSLQSFLILLAIADRRRAEGKDFTLIAEEPELHLHPSLHKRLANRIRAVSTQSLITTHSPLVAASYKPTEAIFLSNLHGQLTAQRLRKEPIKNIPSNAIRSLYLQRREAYYEAILAGGVLVPEGDQDYDWLRLLQRIAETSDDLGASSGVRPLSVVPTKDAAITETYEEICKLRPDAVPIVDGDQGGDQYFENLLGLASPPGRAIRWGNNAAIECVAAWVLQPALAAPGPVLEKLLPSSADRTLERLQQALINNKKDRELRENLASEALDQPHCVSRAVELLCDLAAIIGGASPGSPGWNKREHKGAQLYVADHIRRA
jgi:hypothetical protein